MADFSKEALLKDVHDRGRQVKELEDQAKAVSREIEQLKTRLLEMTEIKNKELLQIEALERYLPESERWTQWHRTDKKDGDPLSLATLITEALEAKRNGLPARNIYVEICKLGWRTDSKKPMGMVVTTLHRRKDLFHYMKNKNWCLKKYAGSASVNESPEGLFGKALKEFAPVPAGQSGAPLPEGIRRLKLQK